jgi:phosphate starvation-inducible PhoH-like protein
MKRAEARSKRRSENKKDHGPLLQLVQDEARGRHVRQVKKTLTPLTETQRSYHAAILANRITFGIGVAGTGKTWYAAALAAEQLMSHEIERIIVTRPAIEAGEELGFMPGDLSEKYEPYFRPVRDALEERLGSGPLEYYLKAKSIEARPLAFLRGATLKNCWVIADEMQNATPAQMKMFLTRIGENSRFIINGDITQKDIDGPSGLADAQRRLRNMAHVSFIEFKIADIVRDPLCQAIASRYENEREP